MRKQVFTPLLELNTDRSGWDFPDGGWGLCSDGVLKWVGHKEGQEIPRYCCAELVDNPHGVFQVGRFLFRFGDNYQMYQSVFHNFFVLVSGHFPVGSTIDIYFHFGSTKSQFSHLPLPKP